MIIVGLLLIIVAILLFGAGAVRSALAAIATVVLFGVGAMVLAFGVDWNGAPIMPAVLGVLGIAGWAIWKATREPGQ